jgi:hypothetical protein
VTVGNASNANGNANGLANRNPPVTPPPGDDTSDDPAPVVDPNPVAVAPSEGGSAIVAQMVSDIAAQRALAPATPVVATAQAVLSDKGVAPPQAAKYQLQAQLITAMQKIMATATTTSASHGVAHDGTSHRASSHDDAVHRGYAARTDRVDLHA